MVSSALALSSKGKTTTRVRFAPQGKAHSPDIKFVFDGCSFPHDVALEGTFMPEWTVVNQGDPGIAVLFLGPHPAPTEITRTLSEGDEVTLVAWEIGAGEVHTITVAEPRKLSDFINGSLAEGDCIGLGWYLGYYVEAEDAVYATSVWPTFTYIVPRPMRAVYIKTYDQWNPLALGVFIPQNCSFPRPPEVPIPDQLIIPRIEYQFGGPGEEWAIGIGWGHVMHYRPTFYSPDDNFVGSVNLMVNYGSGWIPLEGQSHPNPTAQTFVWSPTTTLEDLIGTIDRSKLAYIHFGIQVHMMVKVWETAFKITVAHWEWTVDAFIDYLSYGTFIQIAAPPPVEVYPNPMFIAELCNVSKTTVRPDEEFVVTLTVENRNKVAGEIYLGYLFEGAYYEIERQPIASLERKTYDLSTTAEDLARKAFERDEYISPKFVVGYVEEGMPVGEYRPDTVTYEWHTPGIAVLISEVPPIPPPEEGKIPWKVILPVGVVAGVGVALYAVSRRK